MYVSIAALQSTTTTCWIPHHQMMVTTRTTKATLALFTAVRLVLVFDLLPSPITTHLRSPALASALVNPLYTAEHLREGNMMLELSSSDVGGIGGISTLDHAYDGTVFHLPPLLLLLFRPIFAMIQSRYLQNIIFGLTFVAIDLAVAFCLYDICRRILLGSNNKRLEREQKLEADMDDKVRPKRAWIFGIDPRKEDESGKSIQPPVMVISDLPELCCLLYYCNPLSVVASCGTKAQSLQSLLYLLLLLSIREAIAPVLEPSGKNGERKPANTLLSTLFLAVASYFELYPIVYVVPISIWIGRSSGGNMLRGITECIIYFCLWFGIIQSLSAFFVGDYAAVCAKTYGYVYGFFDLSPNMGLSWYFFVQMFDRFRRYFVAMFALLKFAFVAPITIRLHDYPIVLVIAFFLLGTLLKPVQTLHDASIGLAMICMAPRTMSRMGNASLVSLFAISVPATLFVMDYWLWLETGTGNANYMYFQCLAYNVFLAIITLDFISASVKRDKALRLTEKLALAKQSPSDAKAKSD